MPAGLAQRANLRLVPMHITIYLFLPEPPIRRRQSGSPATRVAMPEAAMHKYGRVVLRKNDIGLGIKNDTVI